jgi:hypothetical protein
MKVGQHIYEMIACNFLFYFMPEELLYVKNNSSEYEPHYASYVRRTETSNRNCCRAI